MLRTFLSLTVGMAAVKITVSSSSSRLLSSFYNKYDHYPPYCSNPSEMESRKIPPLRDYIGTSNSKHNANGNGNGNHSGDDTNNSTTTSTPLIGETRLAHVTSVVRHGARTPWSSEMKCWDGFWDSPRTGVWDCGDLTTFMATPSRDGFFYDTGNSESGIGNDPAFFLFEKRYDALEFPEDGLANVLNGTCEMGQLLEQGYEQEIQNGKILRDAYTYTKGEYDHDERMRLLDLSLDDENYLPWEYPHHLYFRADDYQRTVMSGQILLRGLFDPEMTKIQSTTNKKIVIPLHIADEDRDIVDPNKYVCPRLQAIEDKAVQSPDYQAFENSRNSKEIRDYMQDKVKMDDDASVLDCMMCTICTDRPLPNAADDYDGTTKNWFTKMTEYKIQKYTKVMKYNDAEFAKLGMGPLWYEIMKNINRVLAEEDGAPKLALFAGHDTTLMPLLASLGPDLWKDTEWAPYASMVLIEIHELIDGRSDTSIYTSKFAFRLLYNGKILTPKVDGCHEDCELCDIVHLKTILDPIARRDIDCSAPITKEVTQDLEQDVLSSSLDIESDEEPSHLLSLSTTTGMAIFVILVVMSGLGGSAITYLIMRTKFTHSFIRKRVDFGGAWDIDSPNDGEHGLELTEGETFRDEPM